MRSFFYLFLLLFCVSLIICCNNVVCGLFLCFALTKMSKHKRGKRWKKKKNQQRRREHRHVTWIPINQVYFRKLHTPVSSCPSTIYLVNCLNKTYCQHLVHIFFSSSQLRPRCECSVSVILPVFDCCCCYSFNACKTEKKTNSFFSLCLFVWYNNRQNYMHWIYGVLFWIQNPRVILIYRCESLV